MAKSIGNKLSPFLPTIVPKLHALSEQLDSEQTEDDANELSEACLTTLANIIRRCTRNAAPYIQDLLDTSFKLISYDPNYLYNEEDEEMKEEEEEGWGSDDDLEDEEEDDMGDDEDSSWKVRRGAIHVIEAVIKTRNDLLTDIYEQHGTLIVDRFKERVNDVKVLLLETF